MPGSSAGMKHSFQAVTSLSAVEKVTSSRISFVPRDEFAQT
jgi:hypothetical protein